MRASYLAADVLGVHLVHYVAKGAEIVLTILAINAIVDGYEPYFFLSRITILLSAHLLQAAFVKKVLDVRYNILWEHISRIILPYIVHIDHNSVVNCISISHLGNNKNGKFCATRAM